MPSIMLVLVSNFFLIFYCNFLLVNVGEGSWLVGLSMAIAPRCFVVQISHFKSQLFSFKFSNAFWACYKHKTSYGGADIADSTW
jgi:hypothetical protein